MNLVVGQLVSNVTFLSYAAVYITPSGDRKKQGNFKCFCGKEFVNRMDVILSGNTKSCGCLRYSFKKIKYNKRHCEKYMGFRAKLPQKLYYLQLFT